MLTEAMISAIKRKNIKDIAAEILVMDGNIEGAAMIKDAGRLTDALLKRAGVYVGEPCCEPDYTELKEEYAEEPTELENQFYDLDSLIAKGKKKKAKKLLKAMVEDGVGGSELDKRKTLIKGL